MSYMIEMDSKVDCFEHYKVNSLLEIMFLATLPEYMRRGIGYYLCEYSIELAKRLKSGQDLEKYPAEVQKNPPQIVTALFTSINSQKIGWKLGFTTLHQESHKNFSFQGKTYAERIGDPDCVSLSVAKEI